MTVTSRLARAAGVVLLAAWLATAVPVSAHAELVSSSPAAGATISGMPIVPIVLSFSEALEAGSRADVVGPDGTTIGTAAIDPADDTKLAWTPASPLIPGSWTIRWTSIATDGDILRGTIPFTVAPAGASAAGSPATLGTPAPSPTPAEAASRDAAILPIVAALVAIAVVGFALLRRRRGTGP
jgi:methionine-rich copper-binding protein CopC